MGVRKQALAKTYSLHKSMAKLSLFWHGMNLDLICTTLFWYIVTITGKATLLFLENILLNKATYDCSFANSTLIFTIFGILVDNDIIDRSHNFGCHGNHFGGEMCYHSYQNVYIIKLTGAGWIQGVQHCVIHHWKADPFSMPMVFGKLWHHVY